MRIGIVGLPASGKSTIYHALTGARAAPGGHAKREAANIAVVRVPDGRLDRLTPMFNPKKTVYATVEFADIAGLTGRAGGESAGFSPALLASARQVDALALVLSGYLPGSDPSGDLEELELELQLADLSVILKRLERLDADVRKAPSEERKRLEAERDLLGRLRDGLEDGQPIRAQQVEPDDAKLLRGYGFLSGKPAFALLNVAEDQLGAVTEDVGLPIPGVRICGTVESEIAELDEEDRQEFLAGLGIEEPGINRVIRLAYGAAGLHSFFTVGPDEVRAWTIPQGATAVEAAAVIHTDLARGLIRAEVVAYEDLLRAGGLQESRKLGLLRLEGKTYMVKDGEICHFLSNV